MKSENAFKRRGTGWVNKWFFRLLFSYLPLFIIVLALIFTSFLRSYSERNQEESRLVSEYINQSIMQTVDNQLKAVFRQTSNEMIVNNPIMKFFAADAEGNSLIHYEVLTRLQEIKSAYPLIDSLYAVRFADNMVVGEDIITTANEHSDKKFIKKQSTDPYSTGWSSVRRVEASDGSVKRVVSLVRKGNPWSIDSGMLVIHISLPALESVIESLAGPNYPYVQIADKEGQMIAGAAHSEGSATLAESESSYTGWTYSIRWLDRNAPFIYQTVPKLWIAVMMIASLAGIAGVIYVTYRNYRPVRAITSMIKEFTRKEVVRIAEHSNEIKFIENAMHTLIDRSLESQELVEADKQLKRLRFFSGLMDGARQHVDNWKSDHNRLNNIPADSRFTVIVIEIDHYIRFVKQYSHRDQDLLKYVLKSAVQEMLQEQRLTSWAEWTDNRQLTCIVAYASKADGGAVARYAKIVEWVRANLRFTVTIGVGLDALHAAELNASRAAAASALQHKATLGMDRVIAAAEVDVAAPIPLSRYYALTRSVAAALRVSRQEGQAKLRELFESMRGARMDQDVLGQVVRYFIIQIEQELSVLSDGYQNAWPAIRDSHRLEEAETVDEAEETIGAMMDAIYSHMENVRETRLHRIQLEQARSFVIQHFEDPSLSLDLLSSHFGLNPKYISKLFKDEFGINFMDFVIDLRIKHACKLLTETELPIQDIAEMSGYTNSISFRRTFKKITGLTPGEYRQRKKG